MLQFTVYEEIGMSPYRWYDDVSFLFWHDNDIRPEVAWAIKDGAVILIRDENGDPVLVEELAEENPFKETLHV